MWVTRAFAALYLVAFVLLLIGTFGLFGQERDPLAGVFLMPLGLPWSLWLDGLPEAALLFAAALVPLINLTLLGIVCRHRAVRRRRNP
ncbi:hypothetical protein [Tropicimonas sp. S265A]|uniref:hypothetical protein n=1 Tax=Tropicimonas sp. S265A TaxID=3415134 RepID=UPI003C79EAEB